MAQAAEETGRAGIAFSVVARGSATSRPLYMTKLAGTLRLQPTLGEASVGGAAAVVSGAVR